MKTFRQFGTMLVLLMWTVVPTMVCTVPGSQMTGSERACCQQMKMACGGENMPASHGCCHKDVQTNHMTAIHAETAMGLQPDIAGAQQILTQGPMRIAQGPAFHYSLDTSPPKSFRAAISVLRI